MLIPADFISRRPTKQPHTGYLGVASSARDRPGLRTAVRRYGLTFRLGWTSERGLSGLGSAPRGPEAGLSSGGQCEHPARRDSSGRPLPERSPPGRAEGPGSRPRGGPVRAAPFDAPGVPSPPPTSPRPEGPAALPSPPGMHGGRSRSLEDATRAQFRRGGRASDSDGGGVGAVLVEAAARLATNADPKKVSERAAGLARRGGRWRRGPVTVAGPGRGRGGSDLRRRPCRAAWPAAGNFAGRPAAAHAAWGLQGGRPRRPGPPACAGPGRPRAAAGLRAWRGRRAGGARRVPPRASRPAVFLSGRAPARS